MTVVRAALPEATSRAVSPQPVLNPEWHYHFLGIGGVGMSAIAAVLHHRGYAVSGSDVRESSVLAGLRQLGIPIQLDHTPDALEGAQAVVHTSALAGTHPIWRTVHERGLAVLHRSQAVAGVCAGQRTLAVTGTHGKTTCSALLAHVLESTGCNPTALIGGMVPLFQGRNYLAGRGNWAVVEADESDGSFVNLSPDGLLLTNVEADHLDFHGSQEGVTAAFQALLGRLPAGRPLVYCADDEHAAALGAGYAGLKPSYGLSPEADLRVSVQPREGAMQVTLQWKGGSATLSPAMLGQYNAVNLAGVFALALAAGIPPEKARAAIETFSGVQRRQQFLGKVAGIILYDDYAHHPTEVRATLEMFLQFHGRPITVVFQPHLYSRTRQFAREFAEALRPADQVFVCGIYGAREAPIPGVTSQLIMEHLREHPQAERLDHWKALLPWVRSGKVRPGLLVSMGAGDVTGLGPLLLQNGGEFP